MYKPETCAGANRMFERQNHSNNSKMKLRHYLESINACDVALDWLENRTVEEMVSDCPRGDWLMWIAYWLQIDERKIILTNGHMVNTVRHLMKDKSSLNMVDMAIKYGEGKATKEELEDAASSAHVACSATSAAEVEAAYAAYAAADAACAAGYAAADSYASAAKTANQLETADICRKFLGAEIIEKLKEKLK